MVDEKQKSSRKSFNVQRQEFLVSNVLDIKSKICSAIFGKLKEFPILLLMFI